MPAKPKPKAALPWAADKVERRSVESLVPYAENSRIHSDEQIEQIVASIKEWGWTVPVLVDEEGGIIAGHGRIMAAKKLGIEDVPVMVAAGWTEAQKRAYVIADNKLALNAGWDEEKLAAELKALDALDFDLDLTGFDTVELGDLIAGAEIEEPGARGGAATGPVNFAVQFNIVFDDEGQQEDWFAFVRTLKQRYPESETLGERLSQFIRDGKLGEG